MALLALRLGNIGNLVAIRRRLSLDAGRAGEVGVDRSERRLADVAALRRLVEAFWRRLAGGVGGGEIGAAGEQIVGRGLQAGLRADTGLAAPDRRIEQLLERRRDRRQFRPMRLGAR